jgi:mannan endo-1,4-beta-mannosidase
MSQLVGKTLLGSTFIQDKNPLCLKIDSVTLGALPQFGYKVINNFDIGSIIQTCIDDTTAVVIVYNWKAGVAYIKSGFDLTSGDDSSFNKDFTTFIITSRIAPTNIAFYMGLVGKSFLGNVFLQDTNSAFLKINNVILGQTPKYNYRKIISKDIGQILQTCIADTKAVVIVYSWKSGVAYIKSQFDLTDKTDSSVNAEYTSFIITSRVTTDNNIPVSPTPATPGPTTPPVGNGFLQVYNGNFVLNGAKFVPVGMNAFFLGLMQETMWYPTNAQITEIFEAARSMKATVIRSHTLGFSSENTMTLLDKDNNINNNAWKPIDWAYMEAARCGIKLIIVLCDPYDYYHGSVNTFCAPYGIAKDQFFVHPVARGAFKKYINQYLNHVNQYNNIAIKDNSTVACLELGNELGNGRAGAGSTAVPTQDWITDISKYIKSLTSILVLNGSDECLGSKTSNDFAVSSVDIYSQHFYYDNPSIYKGSQSAANVNKPYIVGEYSCKFGPDWFAKLEGMLNVKGSCAWSIYPHDNGQKYGKRLNHGDGFTFWFDSQSGDNNTIILNLTNHFRRMQSLPTIKNF